MNTTINSWVLKNIYINTKSTNSNMFFIQKHTDTLCSVKNKCEKDLVNLSHLSSQEYNFIQIKSSTFYIGLVSNRPKLIQISRANFWKP